MKRRAIVPMSLAALVAAGLAIVYAWQLDTRLARAQTSESPKTPEAPKDSRATPGSETTKTPPAKPSDSSGPQVIYDPSTLPEPVRQTLQEIFETAQSGDIEAMPQLVVRLGRQVHAQLANGRVLNESAGERRTTA